jgi:hypothetical protein
MLLLVSSLVLSDAVESMITKEFIFNNGGLAGYGRLTMAASVFYQR